MAKLEQWQSYFACIYAQYRSASLKIIVHLSFIQANAKKYSWGRQHINTSIQCTHQYVYNQYGYVLIEYIKLVGIGAVVMCQATSMFTDWFPAMEVEVVQGRLHPWSAL